jgi:hypothetical protein
LKATAKVRQSVNNLKSDWGQWLEKLINNTMKKSNNLIKVFTGTEASAILLKERLDEIGTSSLIKNDSSSAFFGVAPIVIDLYIQESDLKESEPLIREFIKNSNG